MGRLEIRQVESRRDLNAFVRVPWPIYRNDPQWIPPLLVDVKEFINPRKHPFYLHGAAVQFLALRDGRPVGRIQASDDPNYNAQHHDNLGCFGMFECADDPEAAAGLMEAAVGWLRARGRTRIRGPVDYSTNYPVGLLVDGFDTSPRVMMNHNPPYYARLLESCGLTAEKDLFCWWFVDPRGMVERWQKLADRLAARGRIVIRPFDRNRFYEDMERCKEVYNGSRRNHWGFVRLTDAEFLYMARRLSTLADPEMVLLAEVDDRPVGFAITMPDLNEAIRPLNGRLTTFGIPVGLGRFLYRARRIKTARMMVLDIMEDYRRRGIAEMLIRRTLDYGRYTRGFTGAELSWTLEDNYLVNRAIETVGGQKYKLYRIYHKPIGA